MPKRTSEALARNQATMLRNSSLYHDSSAGKAGCNLLVDCCRIDGMAHGSRPYLVAVMDTTTRSLLSTVITSKGLIAKNTIEAIKTAMELKGAGVDEVSINCDFLDPATLCAGLPGVAAITIAPPSAKPAMRSWAERLLIETASPSVAAKTL